MMQELDMPGFFREPFSNGERKRFKAMEHNRKYIEEQNRYFDMLHDDLSSRLVLDVKPGEEVKVSYTQDVVTGEVSNVAHEITSREQYFMDACDRLQQVKMVHANCKSIPGQEIGRSQRATDAGKVVIVSGGEYGRMEAQRIIKNIQEGKEPNGIKLIEPKQTADYLEPGYNKAISDRHGKGLKG